MRKFVAALTLLSAAAVSAISAAPDIAVGAAAVPTETPSASVSPSPSSSASVSPSESASPSPSAAAGAEKKETAVPAAAARELGEVSTPSPSARPYDKTIDTRTDLSGKVKVTGVSPIVYNIGAPLLNASIKPNGDSYELTLSTLSGFEIYYTDDGGTPMPGAMNTKKYTGSVTLAASEETEEGEVNPAELRIVVIDPDGSMSGSVASTYFSGIDEEALATPEPDRFTVSFWSDGGSAIEPQTVVDGEKAEEPKNVLKSGYTFDGWYKEDKFESKWNFASDLVTGDVLLYAKWLSADIEVESNYHTIDQSAKTIVPDKNSSVGEFIRKLRFPKDSVYKLTLPNSAEEAGASIPVQEGMTLTVTAEDGRTSVKYTVRSTVTKTGEVIAPIVTPSPTPVPSPTARPTATPKPTPTPYPTDTPKPSQKPVVTVKPR